MKIKFFFLFLLSGSVLFAQKDTIHFSTFRVELDDLVVTAKRKGFDAEDFIRMVQEDKTFYQAFKNIRTLSYHSDNDIQLFSKKNTSIASYRSTIQQYSDGHCRTMKTFDEVVTGNFYKRKNRYRYYTAKLFDHLFFTHGEICEPLPEETEMKNPKGMDKHVAELKKLIFSPGQKAKVPLISSKTAIFDKKMAKYYDFSLSSKKYKSTVDCYVFKAVAKQGIEEDRTVIKYLETFFDKKTFQIIARNYHLKYANALFDFDVKMKIKLGTLGKKYIPEYIEYDGEWDIPTKKRERAKFSIRFYEFKER